MSVIYVPRAFGGTLIIQLGPAPLPPPLVSVLSWYTRYPVGRKH